MNQGADWKRVEKDNKHGIEWFEGSSIAVSKRDSY